jgi:hypothetical protein
MSASEKLKALAEEYAAHSYPRHALEVLDVALPQIVAVVEATEKLASLPEETILSGEPWDALDAALRALEEALS